MVLRPTYYMFEVNDGNNVTDAFVINFINKVIKELSAKFCKVSMQ